MTGSIPAPGTDRTVLRTAAYADASKLDDRRNIYAYRRPQFDLVDSVLDRLDVLPGARVLDVGCGPGTYLARLRARDPSLVTVGVDLSVGMLAEARGAGTARVACVDATALPFEAGSFDAVTANHMLYHVEPIERAVEEARRVLAPGGVFLAVTNARAHLVEFDAVLAEVAGHAGWWRPSHCFLLDNGRQYLEAAFDEVEVVDFVGELHVPEAEPVVRFARSMRDLSGGDYDDEAWDELMRRFAARMDALVSEKGEFTTRTDSGVFVCR
jgi:SAM-dependent methyltransferase